MAVAADGSVSDTFTLPTTFVAQYSVTATGQQTGRTATTTFTDLAIGTYDQCSNDLGSGYTSGDTGCHWINGNLQANNSMYAEGDATPQRLWLQGLAPGSTHTVTLKYGTTKGGKHAYDYLTTYDSRRHGSPRRPLRGNHDGLRNRRGGTAGHPGGSQLPDALRDRHAATS